MKILVCGNESPAGIRDPFFLVPVPESVGKTTEENENFEKSQRGHFLRLRRGIGERTIKKLPSLIWMILRTLMRKASM